MNAISCANTTGFFAYNKKKMKERKGMGKKKTPFRVKLAAKKIFKSLQGHFHVLLSPLHTIWLPYHLVGIIGIKDITFFPLILVLFLKGDINDKNHMVVGTRALISAFKHCSNNMH